MNEGSSLHDAPSARELVEAVREFLERDVMAATEGRVQFHARVAVNVLKIVERELADGGRSEAAHLSRLEALGVADDAALAAALRDGTIGDDRLAEATEAIRASVHDKLAIANPKHLG